MEVVEARIKEVDPMVWSRPRPFPFMCSLCGYNEVTNRVTIEVGDATITPCLCLECTGRSAAEIVGGLIDRRKAA